MRESLRNRLGIRLDVPESKNAIAGRFEESRTFRVVFRLPALRVMRAVKLDDDLGAMAHKVGVVFADRCLPPKMKSITPQES